MKQMAIISLLMEHAGFRFGSSKSITQKWIGDVINLRAVYGNRIIIYPTEPFDCSSVLNSSFDIDDTLLGEGYRIPDFKIKEAMKNILFYRFSSGEPLNHIIKRVRYLSKDDRICAVIIVILKKSGLRIREVPAEIMNKSRNTHNEKIASLIDIYEKVVEIK